MEITILPTLCNLEDIRMQIYQSNNRIEQLYEYRFSNNESYTNRTNIWSNRMEKQQFYNLFRQ
jgi:hypothetical protein